MATKGASGTQDKSLKWRVAGGTATSKDYDDVISELKKKYSAEQIAMLAGQVMSDYRSPIGILRSSTGFDRALAMNDIIPNSKFSIKGDNLPIFFKKSIEIMNLYDELKNGKWDEDRKTQSPPQGAEKKKLEDQIEKLKKDYKEKFIDQPPPQEIIDMLLPSFNDFVTDYKEKNKGKKNPEQIEEEAKKKFMDQVGFSIFKGVIGFLPSKQISEYSVELGKLEKVLKPMSLHTILGELLAESDWLEKLKNAKPPEESKLDEIVNDAKQLIDAKAYLMLPEKKRNEQESIIQEFINKRGQGIIYEFFEAFDSLPEKLTKEKIIEFTNTHLGSLNLTFQESQSVVHAIDKLKTLENPLEIQKQIDLIHNKFSEFKKKEMKLMESNDGFEVTSIMRNIYPIHHLLSSKKGGSGVGDASLVLLEMICQKNPDFVNQNNVGGKTPLQLAIELKDAGAAKMLIENGANLDNIKINKDIINLHDEEVIELLIDKGKFEYSSFGDIANSEGSGSHSQFRKAFMNAEKPTKDDKGKMSEYINKSFSLKGSKIKPMTPLQYAASQGDAAYVKKLIKHKAQVNEGNPTPLENAFKANNLECIARLINAGARIPPDLISKKMGPHGNTILHYAALNGFENLLKKLLNLKSLSNSEVFSTVNDEGYTPLHLACNAKNPACVKLLVEKLSPGEINKDHTMVSNWKPIDIALKNEDIESVKILSSRLPKELTDITISTYPRTTPQKIWDVLTKGGPSTWNNPPKRKIGEIVGLLGVKTETPDINKVTSPPEIPNVAKSTPDQDAKIIELNNILKNKDETTRDINKEINENRKEPLLNMRQKTTHEKASSVVNNNHKMVLRIIKDLLHEKVKIDNKPKKDTTDLFKIDAINAQVNDLNKISDYFEVNKNVTADQFLERVNETLKDLETSYERNKKKYSGLKISDRLIADQLETISTKAQGRLNAVKDELSAVASNFTVGTMNKINEIIKELNKESEEMKNDTKMPDYQRQARDNEISIEIEALNKLSVHLKENPTVTANDVVFLNFVNQTIKQAQEKTKNAYGNSTFSARTRELFTDLSEPALPLEVKQKGPSKFAKNNMKEIKIILNKLTSNNDPGAKIEIQALEKVLTRLKEKPTVSAKNVEFSEFVKQTLDDALIEKKKTTGSRYNHVNALSVETENLLRDLSATANNVRRKPKM